jgi:ubiquinone/menaquinone biosynthesis C-methylase UbiE
LPDNRLDAVILYDAFHHLSDSNGVLKELHRVLKPDGILSFGDHHMKENEVVAALTNNGLFRLSRKGQRTYSFLRNR